MFSRRRLPLILYGGLLLVLLVFLLGFTGKEALTEKVQTPGDKSLKEYKEQKTVQERKAREEEERLKQPPPAFMDPINASAGECPEGYVFKDRARITDETGRPITKHRVCVLRETT